ncbi:MAG: GTPase-associated protein 1-related protein, partial [Streptosporangiaceae bacterium]
MPFGQLHYTSCESGLSGYSGFQFCAISAGVAREVAREIERLTVYEPPRIQAADGEPTRIEDYPINLLYALSQETGAAIIARTAYVGVDFSNRSGNYFAHALAGDRPGLSVESPLPIELWDAAFWTSCQGEKADLPTLPDLLPTGPVSRESVGGLPWAERVRELGLLLTAMDDAMAGGSQVVLIDADTTAVSRRIAAGCYLLGPDLGRRLTFATYSGDPRRCPTHVVGTVRPAGTQRTDITANTCLFDFTAGVVPDLAVSPGAALLARIGVLESAALWDTVHHLDPSSVVSLSSSFPVLVSAALQLGHGLSAAELGTAIAWLVQAADAGTADYLPDAVRAFLGRPLEDLSVGSQDDLIDLALRADMLPTQARQALVSQIECALVAGMLAAVDHGEPPNEMVALRTASGRERASRGCTERLPGLEPGRALALLAWASDAGAEPAEQTIRRVGQDSLRAVVQSEQASPALIRAGEAWPALRGGMLDTLSTLPPAGQEVALASPAGAILQATDFAGRPGLHEKWLLLSVGQSRLSAVDACVQV